MAVSEHGPARVTLGLPVYNGADYLVECLDSILAQTFADFRLIISDNASTDETRAICEEYAARDSRIVYDRLPENLGATANYNRVVPLADTDLFKWCAHDDNLHPDFLKSCIEALDADDSVVLAYPATRVIDGEGQLVRYYRDGLDLPDAAPDKRLVAYLKQNFMRRKGLCNPIFGVMRTDALRRTRMIQDFLSSDRTLLAHLALVGKFVELPDVLFDRRVHMQISTWADTSFEARQAWFNPRAARKAPRNKAFNNYFALRMTHLRDLYRAIDELVEDRRDKVRCRRALTQLLLRDPKWLYIDAKYSLGFRPSKDAVMAKMGRRREAPVEG